jgi:hypothetical protein
MENTTHTMLQWFGQLNNINNNNKTGFSFCSSLGINQNLVSLAFLYTSSKLNMFRGWWVGREVRGNKEKKGR